MSRENARHSIIVRGRPDLGFWAPFTTNFIVAGGRLGKLLCPLYNHESRPHDVTQDLQIRVIRRRSCMNLAT